jgi:hypothetical protein
VHEDGGEDDGCLTSREPSAKSAREGSGEGSQPSLSILAARWMGSLV